MKYYKINIRSFYPNDRIADTAIGDRINNIDYYFREIRKGIILENIPLLDYFSLESYDKKKYWEWCLFDVYKSRSLGIHLADWLVSEDLKLLLETFRLTTPHKFHPCKLKYKNKKKDYYIFQFAGKEILYSGQFKYIDWSKSIFFDPISESQPLITSAQEFIDELNRIVENSRGKHDIQLKKLVLKESFDFFPMATFLYDNLVSEPLKQAIETMGITGFEFSEIDYEVVIDEK